MIAGSESPVVIFGLGDFAQVAAVYLDRDSPHDVVAFTAHGDHVQVTEIGGRPVVPFEEMEKRFPPSRVKLFVAIGFRKVNQARQEVYDLCRKAGYDFISYVNSSASVWGETEIGENVFIFEENVIQPFVRIGNDVILWSGNHIGHHSIIEDHVFVASHAVVSGKCTIGHHSFIGVNATFRDGVTIGPRSIIGAGALILEDTEEGSVYAVRGTDPLPGRKSHQIRSFQ